MQLWYNHLGHLMAWSLTLVKAIFDDNSIFECYAEPLLSINVMF